MSVWSNLAPRERGLIYIAAALVLLLGTWQFGVKPIITQKASAQQALTTAQRDLDIVARGLPKMQRAENASQKAPFNRSAVIETAGALGIIISRVQPGNNESLQVWFEGTDNAKTYQFLSNLSGAYAVKISRVQMAARDNGLVSAQFTFASAP